MRKKRILWVGEASQPILNTGFSVIGGEILNLLYDTNKYEIFELGAYCKTTDPRTFQTRWPFFGGIPEYNNELGKQRYSSSIYGQFGQAVFEQVCLEVQPDIVTSISDPWM